MMTTRLKNKWNGIYTFIIIIIIKDYMTIWRTAMQVSQLSVLTRFCLIFRLRVQPHGLPINHSIGSLAPWSQSIADNSKKTLVHTACSILGSSTCKGMVDMQLSLMPHVHENIHALTLLALDFTAAAFGAFDDEGPTTIILTLNLKTQKPICPTAPPPVT